MEHRRLSAELTVSNEELSRLANLDGLTGLANRRAFDGQITRQWTRAVETGVPIALALVDLDNFKAFNDLYGHASGDRCLRSAAQAIRESVERPEDVVARFGGEEFAMLLPCTDAAGARLVADRAREAVFRLAIPHRGNPAERVTVSIGYAAVEPDEVDTPLNVIQLADAALYQAKAAGRNRVHTIASVDALSNSKDHFGETTKIRLLRLMRLRAPLD